MTHTKIPKISTKTVFGPLTVEVDKVRRVMRVGGRVIKIDTIETTYGSSLRLKGIFKAINLETGEEFSSSTCYLPDVASNLIALGFDGKSLEFLFDVGIKGVEKLDGTTGYEFGLKSLVGPKPEDDPLASLFAKAPKADTSKTEYPEE